MNYVVQRPNDFASTFEAAFARLQVGVEEAYLAQEEWPDRVVAAVRAAFEFAASDPGVADILTNQPLGNGSDGIERYER